MTPLSHKSSIAPALVERLAIALWDDDEAQDAKRDFDRGVRRNGLRRPKVRWDSAHDLDRSEYRERAERVLRVLLP